MARRSQIRKEEREMETVFRSRGATFALPFRMLALALAIALMGASCGTSARLAQPASLAPQAHAVSAQVAEVLAAQAPEGVDAALWGMLRDELVRELETSAGKRTASAPMTILPMNSYRRGIGMGWDDEFMRADGSGNGIVDVADLSTIVMHYHH